MNHLSTVNSQIKVHAEMMTIIFSIIVIRGY